MDHPAPRRPDRPARAGLDRRRWLRAAIGTAAGVLGAAGASVAWAQIEVADGYVFPARVEVGGQALQLNGAGYRAVAWFKGYAAALYLPRKATTTEQVLAMPGAKRIRMRMLVDVPTQEFVKAFRKGIARNTAAEQVAALRERSERFDALVAALGEVKRGDVVDLDHVPGTGLVFTHNGRVQGSPIPGEDMYAALLRIFLGQRPVDPELKAGMLGGPLA